MKTFLLRPHMSIAARVIRPPVKPVMLFDGDCGFCRRWIVRWQRTTAGQVDYMPLQDDTVAKQFPELSREALESAVHLIEPDGRVSSGAEAVFRSWSPVRRWPLWFYQRLPGLGWLAERGYRFVARHRMFFSRIERAVFSHPPQYTP